MFNAAARTASRFAARAAVSRGATAQHVQPSMMATRSFAS
ncbi:hypothetical protein THAOC_20043, partial [Thalassiosira oceanica]